MEKDQLKATQNQKVFVPLNAVLELQEQYLTVRTETAAVEAEVKQLQSQRGEDATPRCTARESRLYDLRRSKQTFERVIRTLGLPIGTL